MIEPFYNKINLRQQCELLGLNRSSLYYKARPENELNLKLTNMIDEQVVYRDTLLYGVPQKAIAIQRGIN